MKHVLCTDQIHCYDSTGLEISCPGSGHDGEVQSGIFWPEKRFQLQKKTIFDRLTELVWLQDANIGIFPCTWQESFQQIAKLNQEQYGGYDDWRLPNRNELRSLISYQTRKPALPDELPAINVFLGWYWTSTTAVIHPAHAWSMHLEGARMFYGRKDQYQLFWPVRGTGNSLLPATGQLHCFDNKGKRINCAGTGQDGDFQRGQPWPNPRFTDHSDFICDNLTGLGWADRGDISREPITWQQALELICDINRTETEERHRWRLPNINELASLVDCSAHSPALPAGHPFTAMRDGYWSSTTSFFETDWAWVMYLNKGACGVGHKPGKTFYVWPVTTLDTLLRSGGQYIQFSKN